MKFTYEFIESEKFFVFFKKNRSKIFSDDFDFDIDRILTNEEKEKRNNHKRIFSKGHSYYLVAKKNDEIIGWSFGVQKSAEDYYMVNSAVFPNYRNKGIYTMMLNKSVELISKQGFQRIYSLHKMSNNPILIPKLKYGFIITGFEINDVFGSLVELSYYTNPTRRELLEIRIGRKKIDSDKMGLIK
ncbi:GNAT family N-acetyltransferase [Aureispira anguillae]|uniref:GNAT family N-acetyltransferase n=1 Tax=Aureispira anguillae TaxID=2864201 RepID=A0A916DRA6_9BACT|nr:GNAT family N-acetyltransferase [Aureispira anguillae]BDS10540.1 GNAT family N-acetyltransferase [Aureispira anguillae]